MNAKPISENNKAKGCGTVGLTIFGAIFLLAGSIFFWFVFISPMIRWNAARLWPSTEATILTSKVVEHSDSEGSSYSAEFTYKYEVNGAALENDDYGFVKFSGSRKGAQKKQKQYPVGSKTVCYYNPQDPGESVLNRELGWELLFGLIPLVFVLVGAGLVYAAWSGLAGNVVERKKALRARSGRVAADSANLLSSRDGSKDLADREHPDDELDRQFEGPLKLKPETPRWVVLLVVGFFGLFWNGIVSVFVYGLIFDGGGFWPRLGLGLFLTPFVLIGIGLILFFFYTLLGMFNPKVEIALSNGAVPMGGEVDVAWEVSGNARRIRNLKIHVKGQESATYRRGTDTTTDAETFATLDVVSANSMDEIQFGSATIRIPENTMLSFDGGNNAVKWSVEVVGEIPFWPDVHESFVFRVKPA